MNLRLNQRDFVGRVVRWLSLDKDFNFRIDFIDKGFLIVSRISDGYMVTLYGPDGIEICKEKWDKAVPFYQDYCEGISQQPTESTFFQVWIDVFNGRAYATRYDSDEEAGDRYPPHPCGFKIYTKDPEDARQQAWRNFTGQRAVLGIIYSLIRRWLWREGKVATWLLSHGIFNGPPTSWYKERYPKPVFYV